MFNGWLRKVWETLTYDINEERYQKESEIFNVLHEGKKIRYLDKSMKIISTRHSFNHPRVRPTSFCITGRYVDNSGIIRTIDFDYREAKLIVEEMQDAEPI
jgi:hypothetical protein